MACVRSSSIALLLAVSLLTAPARAHAAEKKSKCVVDYFLQLRDTAVYLRRAAEILLNPAEWKSYAPGNIFQRNVGIDAYNIHSLKTDPLFSEIAAEVTQKISKYDREFAPMVRDRRRVTGTVNPEGLDITDLPVADGFAQEQGDVVKNLILDSVIKSVRATGSLDQKTVERYFFKTCLLFHDEATRRIHFDFPLSMPDALSVVYTNWLGVPEDPQNLRALAFLLNQARIGPHRPEFEYFKLGYYHSNAATGLAGLASDGLASPNAARQAQHYLGLAYKLASLPTWRKERFKSQVTVQRYIRSHYPSVYAKYLSGTLTLQDVMGKEFAGTFYGGVFDKLLSDPKLLGSLHGDKTRTTLPPEEGREVIRREQLLWLDLVRVVGLHQSAAANVQNLRDWIATEIKNR